MPLTRQQKEELVADYKVGLAAAANVFLINYRGVTVNQDTELRRRVREVGGTYGVVANRLVLRAIDGRPLQELKSHFRGPTAVAYCTEDPVQLAKTVIEFAKDVPVLELKGGLLEGRPVAAEEVQEIARLPSREQLVAKLVFLLQSPVSRFVRTLAAMPRQLVVVLEQIRRRQESADSSS